jgi:Mn2+/Fe2+ NRAMP family transporter
MSVDHYLITYTSIKEPPATIRAKLKLLGPGFILSASIVGSGELIATTTLGASAGFTAFWIIVISCLVKVAVQLEFGKHTILTGETAMQAFNKLPGPKFGKAKWSVWVIFLLLLMKLVQLGGMIGGTAIVLNMLFPDIEVYFWVFIAGLVTSVLIYKGYYAVIERFSLFMIAMFTILTITSIIALQYTPFAFSLSDIINGQQFHLSGPIVGVAIGAFGITGVASDEIIAYNYWCLEKGYAAYAGPETDSDSWRQRARGWINVMYLDAILAMIIYTIVTAAFYLLGAAVLHKKGIIPEGNQLIETVAFIYTESLGSGIRIVYLVGAFFVLYSSLFATLAAWTRIYPDIFGQIGWIDFFNYKQRQKIISILAWTIPVLWACIYLFIKLPVLMILSGGLVGSVLLFIIVFAVLNFRYKRHRIFKPTLFYDIALWISIISIVCVGIFGLAKIF